MKRFAYLMVSTIILASCGGDSGNNKEAQLAQLKKERAELDTKIETLEKEVNKGKGQKATPVSILVMEPLEFTATIDVQGEINGEEDVLATPQAAGIVQNILVRPGQRVGKGQVLATLDASAIDQQIAGLEPQLALQKTLYEKQQRLWKQDIGTEVQLLQAKTQYEAMQKQRATLIAQRDMYRIKSPINGTVDAVDIKEGNMVSPGMSGIRVVSFDKLKAEATLGENYLGQVQQGDEVKIILPDIQDTIVTSLTYVARSVDPVSRSFDVQARLGSNSKLHPNMSAKLKIASYRKEQALAVPVAVIQNTAEGDMVYIMENGKAKAVYIKTGRTSEGWVEVLEGLQPGDKVITEGFEEVDNGEPVTI